MSANVLVLRTAGINCDKETVFAFEKAGATVDLRHINSVKKDKSLDKYQILALPGGFSYGDDLGAGKIFSLEFLLWFKDQIDSFIKKGGLVIGICNGFQVLVKTGILPDTDFVQKVTLTDNDSHRFEDRWVHLKKGSKESKAGEIWLKDLPEQIVLPVAHGEGKFFCSDEALNKIEENGQVALRYVDGSGELTDYPLNPNGSLNSIAGITDVTGKIFGLMPHPERFMFKHHWPFWNKSESQAFGLKIFENAVNYFK